MAWLAGDEHLLDSFRRGDDPYATMAGEIYSVPSAEVTKEQRAVGKQAILGLGYQMGAKRFVAACTSAGVAMTEHLARIVVEKYRALNRLIVKLWRTLDSGAVPALREPGRLYGPRKCPVQFQYHDDRLYVQLPSGRTLKYAQPELVERRTPWGDREECVQYGSL